MKKFLDLAQPPASLHPIVFPQKLTRLHPLLMGIRFPTDYPLHEGLYSRLILRFIDPRTIFDPAVRGETPILREIGLFNFAISYLKKKTINLRPGRGGFFGHAN